MPHLSIARLSIDIGQYNAAGKAERPLQKSHRCLDVGNCKIRINRLHAWGEAAFLTRSAARSIGRRPLSRRRPPRPPGSLSFLGHIDSPIS
jgi:hypothetical protein